MLIQARWDEMRQKMQVVKDAYISRHYSQCAKYGERLLAQVQGEIHPIHLAYLNFYTALSHDTLAREATLKNRYKELSLAEKHYMAAIAALTPSPKSYSTTNQDHSPSSSTSSFSSSSSEVIWKFRRPSTATSFTSSTSSLDFSHHGLGSFSFPQPPRSPSPTTNVLVPSRPSTPEEYQFAADTAAFVRMVRTHLADVQMLKAQTSAPVVRFSYFSPVPSRAVSRVLDEKDGEEVKEKVRRDRVTRKWRKRFDPSEVQRLCAEAEAELN
ncbi:hypothetical protein DE146DRAFT_371406 [Phaeosphaeria sp. MPI-PUGE-AT-0046c]|nr:hypothetical protein DE146DRAFT_371406 [Phaeosphaeria sp. MPI-PUGE-AT-0046c]